jgi:hypothetical protein
MSVVCKDVVVDKNHYYINNELMLLKQFVLNYVITKKQQKIDKINLKLKKIKKI